jgi:antitoxin component YwqK of YwqJK toxin-antitoxin module
LIEAGIRQDSAHANGTFRKWHPNGILSEQAEFVADKPEGTSTAWFPSGYLKARVTLRDGKTVEQTF